MFSVLPYCLVQSGIGQVICSYTMGNPYYRVYLYIVELYCASSTSYSHVSTIHPTVPDVPEIVSADRISATDIRVTWTQLTLEESRGFLTSYSVAYSPSETTTCPEVDLETNTILTTSSEYSQLVISDLDPRLEYCVGIAASTVAGTGNYSATVKVQCKCTTDGIKLLAFLFICFAFFLVYINSLFQLRFSGIDNCIDWVVSPHDKLCLWLTYLCYT